MIETPIKYRVTQTTEFNNFYIVLFGYRILREMKNLLRGYKVIAIFEDHEEDITELVKSQVEESLRKDNELA